MAKEYYLWLDDIRHPPKVEGQVWRWARSFEEVRDLIKKHGVPVAMSVDFDLDEIYDEEEYYEYTGLDVLKWIHENNKWPSYMSVHSANPVGAERMENFIDDFAPTDVTLYEYRYFYQKKGW